jgi:mannosyltransferase
MQASFDKLDAQNVKYANMLSYHKMCRWNSGMFFKHPALQNYTWYWRVEPNVQYFLLPSH